MDDAVRVGMSQRAQHGQQEVLQPRPVQPPDLGRQRSALEKLHDHVRRPFDQLIPAETGALGRDPALIEDADDPGVVQRRHRSDLVLDLRLEVVFRRVVLEEELHRDRDRLVPMAPAPDLTHAPQTDGPIKQVRAEGNHEVS